MLRDTMKYVMLHLVVDDEKRTRKGSTISVYIHTRSEIYLDSFGIHTTSEKRNKM